MPWYAHKSDYAIQEADFEDNSKAGKGKDTAVKAGNVAALNAADAAKKRAEALIAEAMSQVSGHPWVHARGGAPTAGGLAKLFLDLNSRPEIAPGVHCESCGA